MRKAPIPIPTVQPMEISMWFVVAVGMKPPPAGEVRSVKHTKPIIAASALAFDW
jgi:hypothetical protein